MDIHGDEIRTQVQLNETSFAKTTETNGKANVVWWSLCLGRRGQSWHNSSFYRSGRAMPGLTGSIIGRAGGRIMWGPGIICICPPIGGRIPGPAESKRSHALLQTFSLGTP